MALELKQQLKLTQKLMMTPQLQQAIKLLQMTRLELAEMVQDELEENPVLEEERSEGDTDSMELSGEDAEDHSNDSSEIDLQEYLQSYDATGSNRTIDFSENTEDTFFDKGGMESGVNLTSHLLMQLGMCDDLNDEQKQIGEFIIGNIDESGFLRLVEDVDSSGMFSDDSDSDAIIDYIVNDINAEREDVVHALTTIHTFDPPGVGSCNPRENLLIQARRMPIRDTLVESIIENNLNLVAIKNYRQIAKERGATVDEVVDAVRIIVTDLKPVPGSGFGTGGERVIVPDVYVRKVGGDYVVVTNDDGLPRLRVSSMYRHMLSNGDLDGKSGKEARNYIKERLKSALWLIKSVYQRQKTLYSVTEAIVQFQKEFLDRGVKYLRPLVLKDVAEYVGVHESTVSRVTNGKYVETPRGVFELKYFFTNSMKSSEGDDLSVVYIKDKMKELLEEEDRSKPLSDQKIVEELKTDGIELARRTVAKYREDMGYLSSSKRKSLFK